MTGTPDLADDQDVKKLGAMIATKRLEQAALNALATVIRAGLADSIRPLWSAWRVTDETQRRVCTDIHRTETRTVIPLIPRRTR